MADRQFGGSHVSWLDHVLLVLAAAIGGWAGLFVAIQMVPGVFSLFDFRAAQCCGVGLATGYLPGLLALYVAVRRVNRTVARIVGVLAAATSAALPCALVAGFFGAVAHV